MLDEIVLVVELEFVFVEEIFVDLEFEMFELFEVVVDELDVFFVVLIVDEFLWGCVCCCCEVDFVVVDILCEEVNYEVEVCCVEEGVIEMQQEFGLDIFEEDEIIWCVGQVCVCMVCLCGFFEDIFVLVVVVFDMGGFWCNFLFDIEEINLIFCVIEDWMLEELFDGCLIFL